MIKATEVKTHVTISTVGPRFRSPPGGAGKVGDSEIANLALGSGMRY